MSDDRAFDEPLPWLAAVEDEDEPRGISARRMLGALLVVLVAALIVAGTFFWIGRRNTAVNGPPELIRAPAQPYKVKPPTTGGLDIAGESETAFETSAGEDKDFAARPQQASRDARGEAGACASAACAQDASGQRDEDSGRGRGCPARDLPAAWSSSARSLTGRRPSAPGRPCRRASPRGGVEQADRSLLGRDPPARRPPARPPTRSRSARPCAPLARIASYPEDARGNLWV